MPRRAGRSWPPRPPTSPPRPRRHDLPQRRRRPGQRRLVHPVALRRLRRRHRRRRHRHHAAQPRLRLHARARPSQPGRPAQAATAHAGAGDAAEGRPAVGGLRGDGRRQPGPGARADGDELRRLRHARAGGRRRGAGTPHGRDAGARKRHRRGVRSALERRGHGRATDAATSAAIRRCSSIRRAARSWADRTRARTAWLSAGEQARGSRS